MVLGGIFIEQSARYISWKFGQEKFCGSSWYVWIALGDNPCQKCLELDGKVLQGKNISNYPMHPFCRCGIFEVHENWVAEQTMSENIVVIDGDLEFTEQSLTKLKEYGRMKYENQMS